MARSRIYGTVDENPQRPGATALVFGRETPVELELAQACKKF